MKSNVIQWNPDPKAFNINHQHSLLPDYILHIPILKKTVERITIKVQLWSKKLLVNYGHNGEATDKIELQNQLQVKVRIFGFNVIFAPKK